MSIFKFNLSNLVLIIVNWMYKIQKQPYNREFLGEEGFLSFEICVFRQILLA